MAGSTRTVARDLVHDGGAQRLCPMRPLFRVALHERLERLRLERLHLRLQDVLALKLGVSPSCLEQGRWPKHDGGAQRLGPMRPPSFSARTS